MTDQTEALAKKLRNSGYIPTHEVLPATQYLAAEGVFVAVPAARKAHDDAQQCVREWASGRASPGDLATAITKILAAGPLPPRDVVTDDFADYVPFSKRKDCKKLKIAYENWFVMPHDRKFQVRLAEAIEKVLLAGSDNQPSPASGEQNTPASLVERGRQSGAKEDDGARQSAAGESPAPTPPAPAATRVMIYLRRSISYSGDWQADLTPWLRQAGYAYQTASLPVDVAGGRN